MQAVSVAVEVARVEVGRLVELGFGGCGVLVGEAAIVSSACVAVLGFAPGDACVAAAMEMVVLSAGMIAAGAQAWMNIAIKQTNVKHFHTFAVYHKKHFGCR